MKIEGIFRKSGSEKLQNTLMAQLSLCDYDFRDYNDKQHEIANVLKQILRDMAEPICTFEFVDFFLKSTEDDEELDNKQYFVDQYKKILSQQDKRLPEINKNTLQWLILFMRRLVIDEEHSKMGDQNIGLMFAGNLFRTNNSSPLHEM